MTAVFVKSSFLILQDIGMSELLLIAVVVLLLFGGKKIPELMRGLGKGIREFNDAKNNVRQEIEEGMREKPVQPSAPATTDVPTKEAVDPHHNA
ncbi:sec-independent protein translocase protein TatA [Chitinophaga polysaccharea]|uniref:Sec-independent protein translocase protein TatA n=2 Tax=Chitinophaga TaxID=79328 RepID=A0A847SXY9_9BACT|nr:twin-arginine translocase TatA/TatE family subunit [Chitinophaga eiseniae]NLR62074.1 twin-arginine translocase TatA/TatE family subunit [Chitinophaga polysaccharea]NLR82622.1 twin-arginine translocase TatA/TatE family subunit [Chitinophaga eiseniae]NLU94623.1 twin-arginine translocase TatA/TatE family subunit [Chitinophaga sp. Ak27]TWF44120.1 sec-independent protein translocase protein TatA [Chitinophaga polysaccharea]